MSTAAGPPGSDSRKVSSSSEDSRDISNSSRDNRCHRRREIRIIRDARNNRNVYARDAKCTIRTPTTHELLGKFAKKSSERRRKRFKKDTKKSKNYPY
jgi:hypothetical protein